MRLAVLALLFCPRPQASLETIVAELEANAPRARDLDLRYAARMTFWDQPGPMGESRLRVVPGAGWRSDGSILGMPGLMDGVPLDAEASAVEVGDDLYFWASAADGPPEMFLVLPPAVSLRGARKDFQETLDLFPADFSFRWAYEDLLTLCAVAPRLALARDPGLRVAGREKAWDVLEVRVPKAPAGSLLALYPIGGMVKRYLVDRAAGRIDHVEFEFTAERQTMRFRWSVVSRRDLAGGSVPDEVEAAAYTSRGGEERSDELRLRKRLVSAAVDRGLKEADLLPEERRQDVWVRDPVAPADPESAEAHAGLGLARYRDAIARAVRGAGRPELAAAAVIDDFEAAQKLRPSSPFLNVALLKLYTLAGREDRRVALARAFEGKPVADPSLRAALARAWVDQHDPARALKLLDAAPDAGLRARMDRARLLEASQGARALRDLVGGSAGMEREIVLDLLLPPANPRGVHPSMAERLKSVQAALAAEPGDGVLHEMNLRAVAAAGETELVAAALKAFSAAVADPDAIDRAAALALRFRADPETARRLVAKAPESWRARALLGDALLKAGERDPGLAQLEQVLGRLEREPGGEGRSGLHFLAPAFAAAGREDLLRRTSRAWLEAIRRGAPSRGDDPRTPFFLCIQHLAGKEKYVEAFEELRGLDRSRLRTMYDLRQALRPREQAFALAVSMRLLAESKDAEELRTFAAVLQYHLGQAAQAIPVLERARALAPKDLHIAHDLALLLTGSDSARAAELYEEVLAGGPPEGLDRDPMLYRLAGLHQRGGHKDAMLAALDRIDLKAASLAEQLHLVAQLYEGAGQTDRAMAAYAAFLEGPAAAFTKFRSGAHLRLGILYEQKGEFEQAYRCYSGALRAKDEAQLVPPPPRPVVRTVTDPAALREALLKKVGQDGFIDRWLKAGVPEASAEDRSKAMTLLELLGSDSVIERDEASDGLRKLGPKVAPLLRASLGTGDEEFRTRVRQLLWGWAEPR